MAVEKIRAQFDYSNTAGSRPNRQILDGSAAIQQADAILFTRKADGTMRETDLRPVPEQIASGPLADALGGKATSADIAAAIAPVVTSLAGKATPADITAAVAPVTAALAGKATPADITAALAPITTALAGKATPADITSAVQPVATAVAGKAASGANADITSLKGTAASPGIKFNSASTSLASAATVDIGNAPTREVVITGTAVITSFGSVANAEVPLRFTDAATLTHNPTSLVLQGGANIVTAPGDTAVAVSNGSGNWRLRDYTLASGKTIAGLGKQDPNAVALTGGSIDGTAIGATTPSTVNGVTYFLGGTKVLEKAGQYTALYGTDGSQMFAGGSPTDPIRYFSGDEMLFRSKAGQPFLRVNNAGISVNGHMAFTTDNAFTLGMPALRAAIIYAATGTINTSDAREKLDREGGELVRDLVSPLTPAEIAWGVALSDEIGIYTWRAAYAEKGQGARLHVGMTVQRAIALAEQHGLDAFRYGFICHDTWEARAPREAKYLDVETGEYDESGHPIMERMMISLAEPGMEAGDRYGFRHEELLLFIHAAERAARKAT